MTTTTSSRRQVITGEGMPGHIRVPMRCGGGGGGKWVSEFEKLIHE